MISREYVPENSAKVIKKVKPVAKKFDVKVEKKSDIKKEIKKLEVKPKKEPFFVKHFANMKMTFQLKNGSIITGTVMNEESGFVNLFDVSIVGNAKKGTVQYVWIERCQISHFHPPEIFLTDI